MRSVSASLISFAKWHIPSPWAFYKENVFQRGKNYSLLHTKLFKNNSGPRFSTDKSEVVTTRNVICLSKIIDELQLESKPKWALNEKMLETVALYIISEAAALYERDSGANRERMKLWRIWRDWSCPVSSDCLSDFFCFWNLLSNAFVRRLAAWSGI